MSATQTSYTSKSLRNISITIVFEFVNLILMFVVRFLFLKKLSIEVLAIDSMMKTVLGYVAFADLGVTSIMTFFLFGPIKEGDQNKIKVILRFYRKVYLFIVGLSLILAVVFAFLLPVLFDTTVATTYKLYFVYILFVANLLLSYLFASKKTFLIADQKSYITNASILIFQVVQSAIQIVLLLCLNNYYVYLIVPCLATTGGVLFINFYTKKHYSYLDNQKTEEWGKEDKKNFYKKVSDIIFFRIGTIMFNFTDNIIISLMLSTVMVGYAANYVLIVSAATTILFSTVNSLIGAIGAITTSSDKEEAYRRYLKIDEAVFLLFLFTSLCMYGLSSPFIRLIYGQEYVLDSKICFALVLSFFITGINQTNSLFRSSFGLFKEARFIPLACGIINIGLSVLMCLGLELFGIYLATSIAKVITFNVFDLLLVHSKKAFSKKPWTAYIRVICRILLLLIGVAIIKDFVSIISWSSLPVVFMLDIVICLCVAIAISIIYFATSHSLQSILSDNIIPFLKGAKQRWFVRRKNAE